MTEAAAAVCPACTASVTVFSHQLLAEVPPAAHAAVARALEAASVREAGARPGPRDPAGAPRGGSAAQRFALAEGDGSYRCPACGRVDWVPLTIDLD